MKGREQKRTEEEMKKREEHESAQAKKVENCKVDKKSPCSGICYVRKEEEKSTRDG